MPNSRRKGLLGPVSRVIKTKRAGRRLRVRPNGCLVRSKFEVLVLGLV